MAWPQLSLASVPAEVVEILGESVPSYLSSSERMCSDDLFTVCSKLRVLYLNIIGDLQDVNVSGLGVSVSL